MVRTKNAVLVESAIQRSGGFAALTRVLNPSLEGFAVARSVTFDSASPRANFKEKREPYAHALSLVNDHITVKEEVIEEARAA